MVSEEHGSLHPHECRFHVEMDLSRHRHLSVNLFYTWMILWCRRHCKSDWTVKLLEESKQIRVDFEDAREAMFFKMSPEYYRNHSALLSFTLH